jgi:hypothetical protein
VRLLGVMRLLPSMNRKHRIAFLLGAALIVLAANTLIWISPAREPIHQGRTLRSWLSGLGHGDDSDAELSQAALRELYRSDAPAWLRSAETWVEIRLGVDIALRSDHQRWQRALASAIIPLLSDTDPAVRSGAARALEACTGQASRVVPALALAIHDADQRTRLWATRSVGQMVSDPHTVIPILIKCLNDTDPNVRAYACIGLGRFGPAAAEAVPTLRTVIAQYPDSWLAAEALKLLDPGPVSGIPTR